MSNYILVINPGSTSTKIGVFENDTLLFDKTLRHPAEEIAKFATIPDQKSWRKELVEQALAENNFDMKKLTAICARGGLVKPIRGGTYATSDALLADCVAGVQVSTPATWAVSSPGRSATSWASPPSLPIPPWWTRCRPLPAIPAIP